MSNKEILINFFTAFLGLYELYDKRGIPCVLENVIKHVKAIIGVDINQNFISTILVICGDLIHIQKRDEYLKTINLTLRYECENAKLPLNCEIISISLLSDPSNRKRKRKIFNKKVTTKLDYFYLFIFLIFNFKIKKKCKSNIFLFCFD